jgi:UDP-N-acetyl-alpha-D-muramoyl-L-alanyl-L-glutamate epimerase
LIDISAMSFRQKIYQQSMEKSDNYHKYIKFRKQFKRFTYESFDIRKDKDFLEISYNFHLDSKYYFRPSLNIPLKEFLVSDNMSESKLRNMVFHIGMVELISYWKAACPPEIVIKPYALNEEQKNWWKNLYFNGLGEFFYLNSINGNVNDFVDIISEPEDVAPKESFITSDSVLIPIGGGKDSSVTLDLLSEHFKDNILLILNPRKACTDTASAAGYTDERTLIVHRSIDPVLLKMNDEGFLNGHTPFSALLAFVAILCAAISGRKHIALSNESSANESTVEDSTVNHQYSKSFEFEKDFREYYLKYITGDINYFSFLRPLSELQIGKLFSEVPHYFPVFKSCNAGSKTNIWCCNCPKCLFTYIILSPFISKIKMVDIFGKDLFEERHLLHEFNQLMGVAETKPFECVGTVDEVNASLSRVIDNESGKLPFLLEYYKKSPNYELYRNTDFTALLKEFNKEHFLLEYFENILKQKLKN